MAVSQIPQRSSSSAATVSAAAPNPNVIYYVAAQLVAGIYTITCVSSTVATVTFYANTTPITTVSTVSGSVALNLGSPATHISYSTNTGSNVNILMTLTGVPLASGVSGTLDTITSSGTYNFTGRAAILLVGAGNNGAAGFDDHYQRSEGGSGGPSGGISGPHYVELTGSTPVTIGAASGGTTSFAGFTTGTAGRGTGGPGAYPGGQAGQPSSPGNPVKPGTTGGGGGGIRWLGGGSGGPGGGDGGIGQGGSAGGPGQPGNPGTGVGAGGAGGSGAGRAGGNGTPGAVYVIRLS